MPAVKAATHSSTDPGALGRKTGHLLAALPCFPRLVPFLHHLSYLLGLGPLTHLDPLPVNLWDYSWFAGQFGHGCWRGTGLVSTPYHLQNPFPHTELGTQSRMRVLEAAFSWKYLPHPQSSPTILHNALVTASPRDLRQETEVSST